MTKQIKMKAQEVALKLVENQTQEEMDQWYVDSGASKHICTNLSSFTDLRDSDIKVKVADGTSHKADGVGKVILSLRDTNNILISVQLNKVLYFRNSCFTNIISVSKLTDGTEINVIFSKNSCTLKLSNKIIETSRRSNGLFIL